MERAEIIGRLKGYEWTDVEFKKAQKGVPESAYETVSAFSNTEGGWLVFGVRDGAGGFEIVGVLEVDRVQNEFLSVLRSGQKLNHVVAAKEGLIEEDGKALLVFHIPEARRQDKPIYLGGDIRKSFIRRGAGDERCTQGEIERFLRDAADERYDAETVDLDPGRCFDDESVRWYRTRFYDRNPDRDESLPHLEFLHHWGLIVETGGRLLPTRAAVLLFGVDPAFRQVLPRPVVDWQWHRGDWSEDLPEERWADRLVIEANLVKAWRALVDRYQQRAEKPFSVDPETLRRADRPPDYVAFREAAINLLIHQDYADHTRKPSIRFFDDRTLLWNPGDTFASAEELLDPGEKEVRNPRIVAAFRRIGLSEQAGTGIRAIFDRWRRLGRVPPIVDNDKARKAFQLTLLKEELLSEEQLLFQASLGVRLGEAEARSFAFACREGRLRPRDVRAVTGLSGADVQAVLERLVVQALISPLEGTGAPVFAVAGHLAGRLGRIGRSSAGQPDMVTDQADAPGAKLVTDQADVPAERLVTDQADAPAERLVTDQADAPAERLVTDQADVPAERLVTDQADVPAERLVTDQADAPGAKLVTDQADAPGARLVTDQADAPAERLVTDQADAPAERLVTDQADVPGARLVTDQADVPGARLVTDQADVPGARLVTDQADVPGAKLVTDQVDAPAERLVTDQADVPAARLVTDQVDVAGAKLVTDQADVPAERLVTDQVGSDAPDLSSAQAAPLTELSPIQWKIVALCDIPRTMAEVMGELGLSHRAFFRRAHLDPLLWGGVLRMTHPDRPNHPHQAYVLTEAGAALKARHAGGG